LGQQLQRSALVWSETMGWPNASRNQRFAAIGGFATAGLMGWLGYLFSNQGIFFASAAVAQSFGSAAGRRIRKVIDILKTVVTYDMLYIGGGNARLIDPPLPANVEAVANTAGITGGVRLWDQRMDHVFTEQSVPFSA
jgi:hypothetical protein